jgi:hypothetical protein
MSIFGTYPTSKWSQRMSAFRVLPDICTHNCVPGIDLSAGTFAGTRSRTLRVHPIFQGFMSDFDSAQCTFRKSLHTEFHFGAVSGIHSSAEQCALSATRRYRAPYKKITETRRHDACRWGSPASASMIILELNLGHGAGCLGIDPIRALAQSQ